MHMFFYGTLMPSMSTKLKYFATEYGLDLKLTSVGKGAANGRLYTVAGARFPGAKFCEWDKNCVCGEIVLIEGEDKDIARFIGRLNEYEGCNPAVKTGNLYNQVTIEATLFKDGTVIQCLAYEIAEGIALGIEIEEGKWVKEVFNETSA